MTLLRITLAGERLPPGLGPWPEAAPEHRLTLDPALTQASATSAVRLALRESPAPWVIAQGRAVAPFLTAVGADLSLAVAGAFLLTPRRWSTRPLELAPLPFPSVLVTSQPDSSSHILSKAWGAILLHSDALFVQPQARALIDRRTRDLERAARAGLVGRAYAATGASG